MFVLRFAALAAMLAFFTAPVQGQNVDGPVRSVAFSDYYKGSDGCASCSSNGGCGDAGCASCGDGCASCGDGCSDCVACSSGSCCGGACGCGGCCPGGVGGFGLGSTVCNFSLGELLFGSDSGGWNAGGWTQLGYHNDPTNTLSPQVPLSFNDRPGELNLHQQWMYLEKVADGSNGLDWGFRGDVMYGIDAADTQAFGNPEGEWDFLNGFDHGAYGFAIPQLYAQLAMGDLSVIAGKFFTIVGYEVVTAPDNFFYSHAFTMYNSEPFTHTGVLASYDLSNGMTLYGGWTLGWDTGFNNRNGGSSWLGGVGIPVCEDITVTYVSTAGNFGWRGRNGYSHSVVADIVLTERLNWVLQSDLVRADTTGVPAGGPNLPGGPYPNDNSIGVNQYFFYTINDIFKAGSRTEWWKGDGISHYSWTWGLNIRPCQNIVFRPEVRHQWSQTGFGLGRTDETIFGMDGILTY